MARILVIDDDEGIRKLLHTVLTRKGHEVFLADCGVRGLEQFSEHHPVITILDLNMPGMSGMETLTRLRMLDARAAVIMLSGAGTEEKRKQASALGVESFLAKGFSLFELGEAIRTALLQASLSPALCSPAAQR